MKALSTISTEIERLEKEISKLSVKSWNYGEVYESLRGFKFCRDLIIADHAELLKKIDERVLYLGNGSKEKFVSIKDLKELLGGQSS